MPSAGRALTAEVVTDLVAHGIVVAPIVLHTGVASLEAHETPYPERYRVPGRRPDWSTPPTPPAGGSSPSARRWCGRWRRRSTTTASSTPAGAGPSSSSRPSAACEAVDGLLTGWHEPEASHLQMLEAVAGRRALELAYAAALAAGYRWHEFGDVHLILPER